MPPRVAGPAGDSPVRPSRRTAPPAVVLLADWTPVLVLAVVVAFAGWTLAYQVALVTGLRVAGTSALALAFVVLLGAVQVVSLVRTPRAGTVALKPSGGGRFAGGGPVAVRSARWAGPAAAVSTALAVVLALGGRSTLAIVLLILGSAVATVLIAARLRGGAVGEHDPELDEPDDSFARRLTGLPSQPALWLTGWVCAVVCGVVAALYARPDGDDAYFVNLSTWVGEKGTFPLRDTMFSDQVFPALHSHTPPVHSVEGLLGALAGLLHVAPGAVVYVLAPAPLTALAVLALTYAVAACRIRFAPVAVVAAVASLLCSGDNGAGFGNFFALRIWQGKSMYVAILAPLIVAFGIRYVRRGGGGRLLALGSVVVAALGASNTSIMLVPVALAGLVPAAFAVGGLRRATGVLVPMAYPLGAGLLVAVVAPSLKETGAAVNPTPLDPVTAIPGLHGGLVLTVLAVGLGWAGIRPAAARLAVVGTLVVFAIAVFPPVTAVLEAATGANEVLWRLWWVVPVPLLVAGLTGATGVALSRAAGMVRGRAGSGPNPSGTSVVLASGLLAVLLGLLPLVGGYWVGDPRNAGARRVSPTAWKVPRGAETAARYIAGISHPGDVVLAPWYASRVLAATTVTEHAIAPRTMYLTNFLGEADVHVAERTRLQSFADSRTVPAATLAPMLRLLSVDTVCVATSRGAAVRAVRASGYTVVGEVGSLTCLRS